MGQRLSRRRLLAGAAGAGVLGAGAAAGVLITRGPGGRPSTASPTAAATVTTASPPPASTPTAGPTPAIRRGGSVTLMAPTSFNFDTFDPVRAGDPSVVEVLGRTHSRLLEWADPFRMVLGRDLATGWEQPSPDSLVLHLDPKASWHAPLDRPLTAEDVATHFNRLVSEAKAGRLPLGQRPTDFARVERVTAAQGKVVFETDGPAPYLPGLLASRFALVGAPQSGAGEDVPGPGTGPFVLDGKPGAVAAFRASAGGHREAYLAALTVAPPSRDIDSFVGGRLQEFIARDRRDAAALRASRATEIPCFESSPLITSMFAGAPPWDRPELRMALSAALNRRRLATELLAGRAAPAGPVAPVHEAALTEAELASYPGYRLDPEEDARDAKRLWDAAAGPALGRVTIDIPAVLDPLYGVGATITRLLNTTLGGDQFRHAIEGYPAIGAKVADRRYGNGHAAFWFGWGPPFPDPDPAVGLLQSYRDSADLLGYRAPAISSALDRLAASMVAEERSATVKQMQTAILAAGGLGVIDWMVPRDEVFRQPGLHRAPPSPFWTQSLDVSAWFEG